MYFRSKFPQKPLPPYFFHSAFAPSFIRCTDAADWLLDLYRMPLIVVELLPVDLERTAGSAASCKRQLTLAQVRTDHVRQVRILRQKYQTGSRVRPKLDVQAVSAQRRQIYSQRQNTYG